MEDAKICPMSPPCGHLLEIHILKSMFLRA